MLYLNSVLVKAKAKRDNTSFPTTHGACVLGFCIQIGVSAAVKPRHPRGFGFLALLLTLRVVVAGNAAIAAKITSLVTRLPLRYKRTRGFPWVGRGTSGAEQAPNGPGQEKPPINQKM